MTGQIFADHAPDYLEAGLVVFPTGGDDGKLPLVKNWQKFGRRAGFELIKRFPDANIGVRDGGNGITRIDIDDTALINDAILRFGDTPIKVSTPSGGLHLWYRSSGERRILRLEGVGIDVLGNGGYGVAPPSINPQKGSYRFLEGHTRLITELPPIAPGALPLTSAAGAATDDEEIGEHGSRNNRLFGYARSIVADCPNVNDLIMRVQMENQTLKSPLSDSEVQKISNSVWGYREADRVLLPGGDAAAIIRTPESVLLGGNSDAGWVLVLLRQAHGAKRGQPFPLSNRMAESLGWDIRRFRKAKNFLVELGMLELVQKSCSRTRQPPIYRLRGYVQNCTP